MASRTWIKIYCEPWLSGSIRQESPELRSVFVDLIVLAGSGRYGDTGEIKITTNIGLNDKQISKILGLSPQKWCKIKQKLVGQGRISVVSNNIIVINNWQKYQSEYNRQKPYREAKTSSESYNPKLQPKVTAKVTREIENRDRDREGDKRNIKEKNSPNGSDDNFLLPEWINEETWSAYLEVRRKKKAPNTEHALRLIIKDLEKFRAAGDDPSEVLNQSIKSGWTGVFPLRKENKIHRLGKGDSTADLERFINS